jgi:predicted TIM-barrel fold metal-dependent hydrolase
MEFIDTHVHVIDMKRLSYPWLEGFELLRRDYPFRQWHAEARRCGITSALHMEVDVAEKDIEAETAMVAELMLEPESILRGAISSCRPENADFPAFLERQRANPAVKGFRRVLHVMPDGLSQNSTFRKHVKMLSGTGLPFDLCVLPRQIPMATELADLAPDVQFVLDHCGVPAVKAGELHPWKEHVAEIARRPNVAVKISGVSAYGDADTWTIEDLRPYVEHCLAVFGWDRCVWGGDWPVVTLGSSLSTWVAATQALVAGASNSEREKLFSGNARRIWRM